MTERTHDLAALTMLTIAFILYPAPVTMTLGTFAAAVITNQIGSAVPDFDQPTAEFYRELPVGSWIGKIMAPLFGGHRYISHSLLGLALISWGLHFLLDYIHRILLVDMNIVWWSFVLGYVSHLLMDTITKEGVPWFFPIPIRIGFPPFKFMRVETGKWMEKIIIYPSLIILNGYLLYSHYGKVAEFFSKNLIK
jgi:inner membrane protein